MSSLAFAVAAPLGGRSPAAIGHGVSAVTPRILAPSGRSASSGSDGPGPSGMASAGLAAVAVLVGDAAVRRQKQRHSKGRYGLSRTATVGDKQVSQQYVNLTGFPFPLGPLLARRTVRKKVGDGIWTFEQEQSLANIAVNVRMTAIELESGGLWIHNPVAPTEECVALVAELGLPVRFIVLGSTQYEHKIFVGPFSRKWPDAKVFLTPQQWSWPLDLPSQLYGIFPEGDLKDGDKNTPWAAEIEQRVLAPSVRLGSSVGLNYGACETAFFHRRSKTLLCTDAVVFVPEQPPAVLDRAELVALGRSNDNVVLDLVAVTNWRESGDAIREAQKAKVSLSDDEYARIGWRRNALLALFFGPDGRSILNPTEAFDSISGKWIVSPVCYSLVYSGEIRQAVLDWSNAICKWDFEQIIPGHFAGPVRGTPSDVRRAFEVLAPGTEATKPAEFALPWPFPQPVRYRAQDLKLLSDIKGLLTTLKVI
mmetsp:Transcript_10007/g.22378  ORF Transcript_10007/g.22378 Transcript_10007/m.22378 type:complete len:479 (-) Transcript_10007:104-1540(-)